MRNASMQKYRTQEKPGLLPDFRSSERKIFCNRRKDDLQDEDGKEHKAQFQSDPPELFSFFHAHISRSKESKHKNKKRNITCLCSEFNFNFKFYFLRRKKQDYFLANLHPFTCAHSFLVIIEGAIALEPKICLAVWLHFPKLIV